MDAAVRQANRETTNVLNTDEKKHRRYGRLTALEPSPVALAPASRLRSERHAAWHAQRALEPALDDAWSRASRQIPGTVGHWDGVRVSTGPEVAE